MAQNSNIEWTDHTFNPWFGCTKISRGCDLCYAERRMDHRLHRVRWGAGQPRVRSKTWGDPKKWNEAHDAFFALHGRRQRVFCASLADVFDNEAPEAWRDELLGLIVDTPNLDWLLLTKRIGNVSKMVKADAWTHLPHVWLGATVTDQAEADRDIPKLLQVPARVRFLSVEPMLGPVDLRDGLGLMGCPGDLDWIICGGESGPHARPLHPDWARSLRDQCIAAGVPFLFKQWGEWAEYDGHKPTRVFRMGTDVGETMAARCDGFISLAGEFVRDMDDAATDDPYRGMVRVGKKAAGRALDGVTHDGFPR